jgi:thioredoxin-like negative regulator of GroEL
VILERIALVLAISALACAMYFALRHLHVRRIGAAATIPGTPTLLYFAGEACTNCPAQSRIVDHVSAKWAEQLRISRVDAEHDQETARRYSVFTLPTTIIIDSDGRVQHVNYGLTDANKLDRQLKQVLDAHQSSASGGASTKSTTL